MGDIKYRIYNAKPILLDISLRRQIWLILLPGWSLIMNIYHLLSVLIPDIITYNYLCPAGDLPALKGISFETLQSSLISGTGNSAFTAIHRF